MVVTMAPLPLAAWLRRRVRRLDDKVNPLRSDDPDLRYRTVRRDFAFDCLLAMPLSAMLVAAVLGAMAVLPLPRYALIGVAPFAVATTPFLLLLLAILLLGADYCRRR
jgi:hypothetical protein